MGKPKAKFYAVRRGRQPGVYASWDECRAQVHRYSCAEYVSFSTRHEAEHFLSGTTESPEEGLGEESSRGSKRRRLEQSARDAGALDSEATYRLEFDGASRGNPGQAGYGAVLVEDITGKEIGRVCGGLGRATNNIAEYTALIYGLEAALEAGVQKIKVQGDSMLVINQVSGKWQVKNEGLQPLWQRVRELQTSFTEFKISHVYREHNQVADALSNEGIDTGGWMGLKASEEACWGAEEPAGQSQEGGQTSTAAVSTAMHRPSDLTQPPRKKQHPAIS